MSGNSSTVVPSRPLCRISDKCFTVLLACSACFAFLASLAAQIAASEGASKKSGAKPEKRSREAPTEFERDATLAPPGKKKLHLLLDESAGSYSIYAGDERSEPLKLQPVLRWANLTRGSADGATYIWTANGRPMATACVYPWAGMLCDNFQSLSEAKITAYLDGQEVWRCEKPGIVYHLVPAAPRPDKSASTRKRQMKALAEQFHTTLMGWNTAESDREELRMLPRPVYQRKEGDLVEGAIFAFVQGTDPEAFLLLEVRSENDDRPNELRWQYAMARRTSGRLETRYKDEVVWKAERLMDYSDPRQPHFQHTRPLLPDESDNTQ